MDYKNEFNSDDDFDCSNNSYNDNYNNNNNNAASIYNGSSEQANSGNPNGLSKAELRKTNKPIMEKRRRARINHCLNELKSLILEAMKKDPARHTKLEKADILEMTVKHLQSVQRQQLNMAIQTDPTVVHKFRTGFVECAEEVNRYIGQLDGVEVAVRQRLTNHLSNCANSLEQIGAMTTFNSGYRGQLGITNTTTGLFGSSLPNPLATTTTITAPNALFPPLPQDLNNNNNNSSAEGHGAPIQMGAVQLIPSRLPSGEFALIMPNTNTNTNATSLLNNNNNNTLSSAAFTSTANWLQQNVANDNNVGAAATIMPLNKMCSNATQTATNISNNSIEHTTSMQRLSAFTKPHATLQQQQQLKLPNTNFSISCNATTAITTNLSCAQQPPPHINNLHHNSTTTTSPPLSPVSSMSSHGDDSSIMHTSSDFTNSRPATPPHDSNASQHNFSGVFNTPPSTDTSIASSHSSLSTHLQQQQVSSTSGSELHTSLKRPLADINNTTRAATTTTTIAATMPTDSSDGSLEEPSAKRYAVDVAVNASDLSLTKDKLAAAAAGEKEEDVWRPW